MTPEDFKKRALEASKKEYESIMAEMEKAANTGSFSCTFSFINDGAIQQLKDAGFEVTPRTNYSRTALRTESKKYFEVSYGK